MVDLKIKFLYIIFLANFYLSGCGYFYLTLENLESNNSITQQDPNSNSNVNNPQISKPIINYIDPWSDSLTESPIIDWIDSIVSSVNCIEINYYIRVFNILDNSTIKSWDVINHNNKVQSLTLINGQNYSFQLKAICKDDNNNLLESEISEGLRWLVNPPNTLDFGANSKLTASAQTRTFNELSTPAWSLSGTCNPKNGDVVVTGDINIPVTVPCSLRNGGEFELLINNKNSLITPYFTLNDPSYLNMQKLGRTLNISQGLLIVSTEVFETLSTDTIQYVANRTDLMNPDFNFKILINDIDLTEGSIVGTNWSEGYLGPIFNGVIEGNGKTILNFFDNSGSSASFVSINEGIIRNIKFENVFISPLGFTAPGYLATIARSNNGLIEKINVSSGTIWVNRDTNYVGGIVSQNSGVIRNSIVSLIINSGTGYIVGGVASISFHSINEDAFINNCVFSGIITAGSIAGGIVGNISGSVAQSAFSNIENNLVTSATISASFAGGLVGNAVENYNIKYNLSNANISAGINGGKLVGYEENLEPLTNSYVRASSSCIGCNNTYETSALSDMQLQDQASFLNWDFINVWTMNSNGYPELRSF